MAKKCTCAPSLIQLRNEYNYLFPKRDKASDGCCPSPAHTAQNPKSDHEPWNGYARAYDLDEDYRPNLPTGKSLLKLIPVLLADSRTKYVIYEQHIYYPGGVVRAAKGHTAHLHISILNSAIHDIRPWNIATVFDITPGPAPEPPKEDDDMKIRIIDYADADGNGHAYSVFGNIATHMTDPADVAASIQMGVEYVAGPLPAHPFQGGVWFVDGPLRSTK